jgi:hypothetical protein
LFGITRYYRIRNNFIYSVNPVHKFARIYQNYFLCSKWSEKILKIYENIWNSFRVLNKFGEINCIELKVDAEKLTGFKRVKYCEEYQVDDGFQVLLFEVVAIEFSFESI